MYDFDTTAPMSITRLVTVPVSGIFCLNFVQREVSLCTEAILGFKLHKTIKFVICNLHIRTNKKSVIITSRVNSSTVGKVIRNYCQSVCATLYYSWMSA